MFSRLRPVPGGKRIIEQANEGAMRTCPSVMFGLAAASLLLLVSASACGDFVPDTGHEGVSELRYAPRQVYTDDPYIAVTLTTTERARSGFHYVVAINVDNWPPGCYPPYVSDSPMSGGSPEKRIIGGVDTTYVVRLRPLRWDPTGMHRVEGDWCDGDAEILVLLEEIGVDYTEERSGPEILRRLTLEIEPWHKRPGARLLNGDPG